jgi:WD40 repeat protein
MTAAPPLYDGFISYSHAAVRELAPALQQAVQRFATPWYRRRSLRLFRDETAMSADPRLWAAIETALQRSSWFILLASPQAAASPWVRREVEWWLAHRSTDQVLIVLVAGHLEWDEQARQFDERGSDALPGVLLAAIPEQPRWVDLTFVRDALHVDRRDPRFLDGVADIAAAVHERPKDEIVGEDIRQHRRARALAISAVSALATLLAVAVVLGVVAWTQNQAVVRQRDEALSGRLAAAADEARERDPRAALQLGVAASRMVPPGSAEARQMSAAVEGNVLQTLLNPYRGMLPGHGDEVTATAWSPDGETVAIGDLGGRVTFAVLTGSTWTPHPEPPIDIGAPVRSLAFSPDGTHVVVGSSDGRITLMEMGRRPHAVESIVTAAGDELVAGFESPHDVLVVAPGAVLRWRPGSPPVQTPLEGQLGSSTAVSPDGSLLVTVDYDSGEATFWDLQASSSPLHLTTVASGQTRVVDVAFTADGETMISASQDGSIVRWNTSDPEDLAPSPRVEVEARRVVSATVIPDGSALLLGSLDNIAVIVDPKTGEQRGILHQLVTFPTTLAVSPDGATVIGGSLDGTSVLWSLAHPAGTSSLDIPDGPVVTLARSPDLKTLVTGSYYGVVAVYDVESSRLRLRGAFFAGKDPVGGLAFDAAGTTLAISVGTRISVWSLGATGAPKPTGFTADLADLVDISALPVPAAAEDAVPRIETVAFGAGGRTLIFGGQIVRLWKWEWTESDALPHWLTLPEASSPPVFALAVSPDGDTLVTSDAVENVLHVWDVASGDLLRSPPNGHDSAAADGMTFVSESVVATGGRDGAVVLNDIARDADRSRIARLAVVPQPLRDEDPTRGRVFALSLSPDGRLLGIGGGNGATYLCDLSDPTRPRLLGPVIAANPDPAAPNQLVTALIFVDEGRALVSATGDENTPVLVVDTGAVLDLRTDALAVACARTGGALSPRDWRGLAGDRPYEDTCA